MTLPVSREHMQAWKRNGITDREIAEGLDVNEGTVRQWRRKLRIDGDGEHWDYEPDVCQNPHCGREVNVYLKNGLCQACEIYKRQNGRLRTQEDMYTPGGASGLCSNCKRNPAKAHSLCDACLEYQQRNGKKRPYYLIERGPCRTCGRPHQPSRWNKGYCNACAKYRKRTGRERPRELWEAEHWCECRQPATHEVEVTVLSAEGHERTESYWLCDACYADERAETNGIHVPRNGRMVGTKV